MWWKRLVLVVAVVAALGILERQQVVVLRAVVVALGRESFSQHQRLAVLAHP